MGFGSHQADPLKSPNDAMNDRLIDLSCVAASGKAWVRIGAILAVFQIPCVS